MIRGHGIHKPKLNIVNIFCLFWNWHSGVYEKDLFWCDKREKISVVEIIAKNKISTKNNFELCD